MNSPNANHGAWSMIDTMKVSAVMNFLKWQTQIQTRTKEVKVKIILIQKQGLHNRGKQRPNRKSLQMEENKINTG